MNDSIPLGWKEVLGEVAADPGDSRAYGLERLATRSFQRKAGPATIPSPSHCDGRCNPAARFRHYACRLRRLPTSLRQNQHPLASARPVLSACAMASPLVSNGPNQRLSRWREPLQASAIITTATCCLVDPHSIGRVVLVDPVVCHHVFLCFLTSFGRCKSTGVKRVETTLSTPRPWALGC